MKKISLILSLFIGVNGFSQNLNKVKIHLLNKVRFISDSIIFSVDNKSFDTLRVYFSLQVREHNKWNEIYNDIYNVDRESLKQILILPNTLKIFSYQVNKIAPAFRKKIGSSALRIEMVGFYNNFREGIYKKRTTDFSIKY